MSLETLAEEGKKAKENAELNQCRNYQIPCPYALKTWSELPCIVPSQTACDAWREKYARETKQ